jgi:integrase
MAIRKFYSKREKKHWKYDARKKLYWSHGFDIRLASGQRLREAGFMTEADAAAAIGRIRSAEKDKKYGFIPESAKPKLADLIARRLDSIRNPRERSRSTRILGDLASVLPPGVKVTELTTAHLQLFVDKRFRDGLLPQSVSRELNSVAAALNSARRLYPQLDQWAPPAIPRPKHSKGRRERIFTDDERRRLLEYLFAPRRDGERPYQAAARRRVGLKVQFSLLTGMRHGEMNKVRKEHVDWDGGRLKILGTKTQNVSNPTRYINLTKTTAAILREFVEASKTDYVFSKGGNTGSKFYRIFTAACEACRIPYGRKTPGGLVLHDARHTATTRMLQANVDLATIQSVTGHSDKTMVLYYSHATPETSARAADVLEAFAGDGAPAEGERPRLGEGQLNDLMTLFERGRIDRARLYRVLQGAEDFPSELMEESPVE